MAHAESRILAVTDLSPSGDIAIREANQRARKTGALLGVVHAVPTVEAIRLLFPHRLADEALFASQLLPRAEATLRHRLETLGVSESCEVFVEQGSAAEVILDVIERWAPTLLVIGSPADGAIGVVGLVRHATMPVVVARSSRATGRVVVGTDFSDPSLPALRAAASAATLMAGELLVVHAVELIAIGSYGIALPGWIDSTTSDIQDDAKRRLDEALARLGVHAKTEVYIGPPASGLIEAATRFEAELMVVGTHGRSGLTRFVLGSVAEAVIQRAPCSVFVTRIK